MQINLKGFSDGRLILKTSFSVDKSIKKPESKLQSPPESQVGTASLCIAYISFCRGGERAICIIEVQEANFIFILSKLFQE